MGMKYGKISQTAWNRSVRKKLHTRRDGILFEPSPQTACAGLRGSPCFLWANACISGNSPSVGCYAVLQAAGELAAAGAAMTGAFVNILLPYGTEEEELGKITAEIETACGCLGIQVSALQGEVTSAVTRTAVFVSGAGEASAGPDVPDCGHTGCPGGGGAEILFCGYAGLEGTLRILDEAEPELRERFVPSFLAQTRVLRRELMKPVRPLCAAGISGDILAVRQAGSGGILAALWDLAEMLDTGFEVDMSAITLRQETVEICEFCRLNPYQLTSAGSFLIVTRKAEAVLEMLEKAGVRAGRLGAAKAQKARVITNGEEDRYLDRPAPDELEVWMARRRG